MQRLAASIAVAALLGLSPNLDAAQQPVVPEADRALSRLERLAKEIEFLSRFSGVRVPSDPAAQKLVFQLDSCFLGNQNYYGGFQQERVFVGRVQLLNLTSKDVSFRRDAVSLKVDEEAPQKLGEIPPQFRHMGLQLGNQHQPLQQLQPPEEIKAASGAIQPFWVVFGPIPAGRNIPKLVLQFDLGDGKTQSLDVNASQKRALGLDIERIGPQGSLGLVTISGELNTVNYASLLEELDQLGAQKVGRVVLRFADSSAPINDYMMNWLMQQTAAQRTHEYDQSPFSPVTALVREFHLARLPKNYDGNRRSANSMGASPRVHDNESDAIRAALRTAYESIPRDQLLLEVESPNRHTRAAAIACGGGRLPADKLPLLIKAAADSDVLIQDAALYALRHFGDPAAVETLVAAVKKNVEPLSTTAIASLAASRYGAAHDALTALLLSEPPEQKKKIVAVLAQHPRPVWGDVIFGFVRDDRAGLNQEALKALNAIGHPQLVPLLAEALAGKDEAMRQLSLSILVSRKDDESERLALEFALEAIKKAPPDGNMVQILSRVKDQRALPLLMPYLDRDDTRSNVMGLLIQIGDEKIVDQLLARYEKFAPHEKAQILESLRRMKSAKFRELAKAALATTDGNLLNTATQGLVEDGSEKAMTILIEALKAATNDTQWSYICNSLGMFNQPAARDALVKMRDTGAQNQRQYAINGLQQMRNRSPGMNFFYQGQYHASEKKWKDAINFYDMAIQSDATLAEAYAGRGDCYMKLEKHELAGKDFAKAFELDPYNALAAAGVCITMAIAGKTEEAATKLESLRERFQGQPAFSYNAACMYARALSHVQGKPELEKRDELIQKYTDKALADLQLAVQQGFQDFDWMKKDPDLKPLRDHPKFQEIKPAAEGDAKPAAEAKAEAVVLPQ